MWMHDGEIVKVGNPAVVCPEYRQFMRKRRQEITDELIEELHQEMKENQMKKQAAQMQQ